MTASAARGSRNACPAHVFASVTHPYQGHDMTSFCWLVVMDSERFASPIEGIFCGGLNAYCMHIRPLFLRTSGSSGVLQALLLERNGQLSCNPKKNKKKKKNACPAWGLDRMHASGSASCCTTPRPQQPSMAGALQASQSAPGFSKAAHCLPCCM